MDPISELIWQGLDHLGLSGVAANVRNRLQAAGLIKWKPLAPPDAFTDCTLNLIKALEERGQSLCAYVEFGVSRGTSMACSFQALKQTGHADVRLVGLGSFEGMPPGSQAEGCRCVPNAASAGSSRRERVAPQPDGAEFIPATGFKVCCDKPACRRVLRAEVQGAGVASWIETR